MDCIGTAWDFAKCLWGCSEKHAAYICDLEDNLTLLASSWRDLEGISEDLKRRVDEAESTQEMRRTNEVQTWLDKVDAMKGVIEHIQLRGAQEMDNKCLSNSCSKNCVSSYKLGNNVVKTLKNVDELITSGRRFGELTIAYKLPRVQVDEMPVGKTVGLDLMLDTVWHNIKEENVDIIGLHGMGGVGKTTLLEKIKKELEKNEHDFDVILWVVVSKDCDTDRIINDIRRKLEVDEARWNGSDKHQRVATIYKVLKSKKFILLLDDLWEKLELKKVGIPLPEDTNNQSKVIFTTRSQDVCARMKAQKKHEVKCLPDREAYDLFCMEVGEETLQCHRDIPKLAREMAKECKGLPLALITVGSAMAGVTSVQAWEDAKNDLTSSPSTASNLEKNVFSILKFSYDRLPDETHKKCFLYCALYPEDFQINVPDLIYRWIGEGFLGDQTESIRDMHGHGESVVARLQNSSLLQSNGVDHLFWNRRVKMHDVIRDMAIWLSRDQDQNKTNILLQWDALAESQTSVEKWKLVERISVTEWDQDLHVPPCHNLLTLIVSRNDAIVDLANIKSMGRLKVLDLSYNYKELKLPAEIGRLIHLNYLNLSGSRLVSRLPSELKFLKNLKIFLLQQILDCTLEIIPLEVISGLEQLKVFRYSEPWLKRSKRFAKERAFLEKLGSLPNLEEVLLQVGTHIGLKQLLKPTKLQSCMRFLILSHIKTPVDIALLLKSMSRMKHLEGLRFCGLDFNNMDESSAVEVETCHFDKLRWLSILWCNSMTHLTWLKFAPRLEILWVNDCVSMEEVIKGRSEDDDIFSYLTYVYFGKLPRLESFHKTALPFPSLKYIQIYKCPNLKVLPFDCSFASANMSSLREIRGSQHWFNHIEWENQATMDVLQSKFVPIRMHYAVPLIEDPFSPFGYQPYFDGPNYSYGFYRYDHFPPTEISDDQSPNSCSGDGVRC